VVGASAAARSGPPRQSPQLTAQHAAVTTSGASYQATFAQPIACNERVIVFTTSPGTYTAGGDYLATGWAFGHIGVISAGVSLARARTDERARLS
jgi:hypothetical protein